MADPVVRNLKEHFMFKKLGNKGQGMTEYIIILAMVAVGAIVVFKLLGAVIREKVSQVGTSISTGKPSVKEGKEKMDSPDKGLDSKFYGRD
jgi:Flp pilus assembly pilin Flp